MEFEQTENAFEEAEKALQEATLKIGSENLTASNAYEVANKYFEDFKKALQEDFKKALQKATMKIESENHTASMEFEQTENAFEEAEKAFEAFKGAKKAFEQANNTYYQKANEQTINAQHKKHAEQVLEFAKDLVNRTAGDVIALASAAKVKGGSLKSLSTKVKEARKALKVANEALETSRARVVTHWNEAAVPAAEKVDEAVNALETALEILEHLEHLEPLEPFLVNRTTLKNTLKTALETALKVSNGFKVAKVVVLEEWAKDASKDLAEAMAMVAGAKVLLETAAVAVTDAPTVATAAKKTFAAKEGVATVATVATGATGATGATVATVATMTSITVRPRDHSTWAYGGLLFSVLGISLLALLYVCRRRRHNQRQACKEMAEEEGDELTFVGLHIQ